MLCIIKPNMLKQDVLLQKIVVLLKNSSQKRKQTNLLITTNVTVIRNIKNTVFDLLQKLNISSSNDSSLSLDTFSFLEILFCKKSFSARFNS